MLYTEKNKDELLGGLFKNPPPSYRGAPFWAWNSKLNKEMLTEQIDVFKKMGFGGVFMHTRVGLQVEYLGQEFMDNIIHCTNYARDNNMLAWLYDEDRYPSGAAGGFVTRNKRLRARKLVISQNLCQTEDKETALNNGSAYLVACYDAEFFEDRLIGYKKIEADKPPKHTKLYAVCVPMEESGWFNNETYADLLNKDAVDEFIKVTHEKYKNSVGSEFSKTVPGIFTDEPQYIPTPLPSEHFTGETSVPWTADMEEDFSEKYGLDIIEILPEIFWDSENKKYRYIFRRYLSERFAHNFSKTVGKWCDDNNIFLTGHMMAEQTMESQTQMIGEAMLHYGGFAIPGIDMLLERHEYLTAKQAQSAVHQKGSEGMLSELYGVTDWDYDFRGYKEQGDWQAALGVTLRVPHLAHFSMRGEAKRDFPASINYQSPWHEEFGVIETHFARLNTALTRGRPIVRLGIIHPIESYWHECVYGRKQKREQMDKDLEELIKWLLFNNIDFDFISESLSQELGATANEDGLKVGNMKYSSVLVPNCIELRQTTRRLLDEFEELGGKVIYAGRVPDYSEGEYTKTEKASIPFEETEILNALEELRDIKIIDINGDRADRMIYNYREDKQCRWLFVCHGAKVDNSKTIRPKPVREDLTIRIKGEYNPLEYDTLTGDIKNISYYIKDGFTYVEKKFYTQDSLLLKLCEEEQEYNISKPKKEKKEKIYERTLKGMFEYTLSEENVMLLDCGNFALDNEEYSKEEEELLRADCILKEKLNFPRSGLKQAQPWVIGDDDISHTARVKFSVISECEAENVFLALEDAQNSKIIFNGNEIKSEVSGFYVDKSIGKVKIGTIHKGENEIEVEIPFGKRSNVEWMYLLGDFGVRVSGTHKVITQKPQRLGFSSVTNQGLPFYTGNISYVADVETDSGELSITVPKYRGALMRVYLDGEDKGIIAFEPYKLDLGTVKTGQHRIVVNLYGNRFNGFGSLHNIDDNNHWAGPERWRTEGNKWGYEYSLRDMGILSGPIIKLYTAKGGGNEKDI